MDERDDDSEVEDVGGGSGGSGGSDNTPSLLPDGSEVDSAWGVPGVLRLKESPGDEPKEATDDGFVCVKGSVEDQPCIGVELEFLLAMCPTHDDGDAHPAETRYLSKSLTGYDYDQHFAKGRLQQYAVNRLLRVLRRAGLPAHEPQVMAGHGLDITESELSDEAVDWREEVTDFKIFAQQESIRTNAENQATADRFFEEWKTKCASAGALMRAMPTSEIDVLCDEVATQLRDPNGWDDEVYIEQVVGFFKQKVTEEKNNQKKDHTKELRTAEDPDYVRANGLNKRYRAWTAVQDVSVDGNGMTPNRYNIPNDRAGQVPMEIYQWFGAEVVSPVLPQDSEVTAEKIRQACAALRNYFRIHKPMEASTGLHVHFGHKHGWNLYEVKRFASIWLLVESTLIHCHTKDRGAERMKRWCARMIEGTKLAQWLFGENDEQRRLNGCAPNATPAETARGLAALNENVVLDALTPQQREFLENVWTYPSLLEIYDALWGASGLYEEGEITSGARIRITGEKRSRAADEVEHQTIEIRTMHGTVDANHINHWIVILRRIMHYVRNSSAEEFRDMLLAVCQRTQQNLTSDGSDLWVLLQILEVPEDTRHFYAHPYNRGFDTTSGAQWFVYPDRDRVDWADPFVVRGHGATHGNQYDELAPYP
ncbi:uncharacterized protein F4807DRAFT_421634 [Annulohypoxylon truncatum]|uniref:uncharacterized protein n=1 Tax=Annulohypoxylon truncatum TaxID=327061 RepID=UPI002008A294|nr:uncharacterized protein F4807DRAFT_421634 [Annulohypoxylon truncatum]KAI1211096.1 hypothetical protein F4807DRAFT_421634 [Annulohypoxylon truncatum]